MFPFWAFCNVAFLQVTVCYYHTFVTKNCDIIFEQHITRAIAPKHKIFISSVEQLVPACLTLEINSIFSEQLCNFSICHTATSVETKRDWLIRVHVSSDKRNPEGNPLRLATNIKKQKWQPN